MRPRTRRRSFEDLVREAIRLARLSVELLPEGAEARGLLWR
jgi:predicted RNA polymerase sigma factor